VRSTPDDPVLASLAPDRGAPWIALQVVDTGVGVAERDRERIFDEFEQVNAGPRTDSVERGTGLGLAISRRLARSLGGDITVESHPGKGSTFTMWLPVDTAELLAAAARTSPGIAQPEATPSEKST
jgi:signal transduction histidine kinase